MKKILITGCSGFIGTMLARKFKDKYELHGLVTDLVPELDYITQHEGNLLDFPGLVDIVKKVEPDFIVHLAAMTEVEKSFYDPTSFASVNYVGTVNLVEAIRQVQELSTNWSLELLLFSSTMETYGWQDKCDWKAFDELTPQKPNAPYAVAKVGCEYYLKYAERTYGIPFTILRQTNSYGREDNDFFVVEQFITQMLKNSQDANFGYREPYRNFIHIDDLLDLYEVVLRNVDLAKNEIFCTGPDNTIRIEELAKKIAKIIGWKGKIQWGMKPKRPGEIYYLNSSNAKAKMILGWEPKISLDVGLAKTVNLWKKKLQ